MNDDLTGEIVLASGDEEARLPDIPRDVLKALHIAVVGKKEQLTLNQHSLSIVDTSDLEQLCLILGQWSSQYNPISRHITLAATHAAMDNTGKKYRYRFSSLESFKKYDIAIKDPVTALVLHFSMVSQHPETGAYQPLDLTMDFTGLYQHPYYYLEADSPGRFRFDPNEISCKISIEYVDHLISKSLQSAVEDWYSGLPLTESFRRSKLYHLFEYEYSDSFPNGKYLGEWLPLPIACFFGLGIVRNASLPEYVSTTVWFFIIFVFLTFLISTLVRTFIHFARQKLHFDSQVPLLRLNSGNLRQVEKFEKSKAESKNAVRFWLGTIFLSFLVSVGAGVFVNFFWPS